MDEKRNQAELEIEFLEKEFLKNEEESLPLPKKEIEIYEDDVQEIMKCGCNRQIAEYVMLKYKELEDKECEKGQKLCDLREKYKKLINPIIDKTIDELVNAIKNNQLKDDKNDQDEYEYEAEINEILQNEKLKIIDDKEIKNISSLYDCARYFFKNNYEKQKDDNLRKAYINKRDAVIEAALRKVKKIVNDEEEYKIFYKEYYNIK